MIRFVVAAIAAIAILLPTSAHARPHADGFGFAPSCWAEVGCGFRPAARRVHQSRRSAHKAKSILHRIAKSAHETTAIRFDPVKDAGPATPRTLVMEARRYVGTNPGGWRHPGLWCAEFINRVLHRAGYRGTGSALARDFAHYGRRLPGPRVGAIAVMWRGTGGHVGVVSGFDRRGNPVIISGNHGHRVAESVYPRGRVYAYVVPL